MHYHIEQKFLRGKHCMPLGVEQQVLRFALRVVAKNGKRLHIPAAPQSPAKESQFEKNDITLNLLLHLHRYKKLLNGLFLMKGSI